MSKEFDKYLTKYGIRRELTWSYTPEQNGVAEWKNRVIMESARAMLNEKDMPLSYWAKAILTTFYVMNPIPTAGIHEKTPYE